MNSPTSSHDDSLSEPDIALEQAPSESAPAPAVDEPAVSTPVPTPAVDESTVSTPASAPAVDEPIVSTPAPAPTLHNTPPIPPASVPMKQADGRSAAGWAMLLALMSFIIAGFALWQAYDWRTQYVSLREDVAKRLQESDLAVGETRVRAQQEHESLSTLLGKISALESQLNKSEGHAAALEALYQQFSRSQEDRIVAEVQQAVAVAGQQLQYAGNIEMALIALRAAQARLEQNDHGQFTALRQALRTDIEKLSQQSMLDMPGTALRLERALEKIDTLPLAYHGEVLADRSSDSSVKKEGEGIAHFIRNLAGDIWAELRSLVKFERLDTETEPVLLAPEQSAFLRENVKIRLLTARLAMLARDGHTYGVDLKQTRNWIERFFDMRNEDVKAVVEELRALEAMPVGVMRYELIESTAAVRRFQARGVEPPLMPLPPPDSVSGEAKPDPAQPTQQP